MATRTSALHGTCERLVAERRQVCLGVQTAAQMWFCPHSDWPACHVTKRVGSQMPLLTPLDPLFCARLIFPFRSRLEELAGAIRAKLAYFDELEAVAAQVACSSCSWLYFAHMLHATQKPELIWLGVRLWQLVFASS